MSTLQHYHDDARPHKRARPDDNTEIPYPLPGPSAHPDGESQADASARRNRKRPLSCGECRRLKLKCDRVFPCQSCCKRGCAEICPDGALIGGKGSRFILANTEQLHEKIKTMGERINQLEDALHRVQAEHSTEIHPLLRPELLTIKRSAELFGTDRPGMQPDNTRREDDDHPSVGSVSSPQDTADEYPSPEYVSVSATSPSLGLPYDIAKLSRTCPVPKSVYADLDPDLRQRIREMLPTRPEAQRICEQAQENAFWHYSPDTSESFIPNLIHSVYTTPIDALLPHRLSLFLMILAIGTAVDLQPNRDPHAAERYHHLARAAVCETAVIDDPSSDTINTLFYMVWYLMMFTNHKRATEHAWGLMGLLAKLAQSLGLHRDGVGKMIPEELDKRKALLWSMMSVDVRLALMLRRPPSISIHHVDVKRPVYSSFEPTNWTATYHQWRDTFLEECQFPVLAMVVSPQPPAYTDVLKLDAKIRDFEIPEILRMVEHEGAKPVHPLGIRQALTRCTREIAILNLHRSYFTQALSVTEGFTVKHKYAPSVLATYTAACNLMWATELCFKWEPELTLRHTMFWTNCLSGALALCLLLGRAPSSPLSPRALDDLYKIRTFFRQVKDLSATVARALPPLEACLLRARIVYVDWCNGSIERWGTRRDDEICVVARRAGLLPSPGTPVTLPPVEANPFEHAHPKLRSIYDSFMARVPSAFVDPHPGSLEPVPQLYSTSAERTVHADDSSRAKTAGEASLSQNVYDTGITAEFLDSSWMTWF